MKKTLIVLSLILALQAFAWPNYGTATNPPPPTLNLDYSNTAPTHTSSHQATTPTIGGGGSSGSTVANLPGSTISQQVLLDAYFANNYYFNEPWTVNTNELYAGPASGFYDGTNFWIFVSSIYYGNFGARLFMGPALNQLTNYGISIPAITNSIDRTNFSFPYAQVAAGGWLRENGTNWTIVNSSPLQGDYPGNLFLAYAPYGRTNFQFFQSGGTNLAILRGTNNGVSQGFDKDGIFRANAFLHVRNTYFCFYNGSSNGMERLGFATAPAITGPWTKYPGNPILQRGTGGVEGSIMGDPCVLDIGGAYVMAYSTQNGDHFSYAYSYDLTNWMDWTGNQPQTSISLSGSSWNQRPYLIQAKGVTYLLTDVPAKTNYAGYAVNNPPTVLGAGASLTANNVFTGASNTFSQVIITANPVNEGNIFSPGDIRVQAGDTNVITIGGGHGHGGILSIETSGSMQPFNAVAAGGWNFDNPFTLRGGSHIEDNCSIGTLFDFIYASQGIACVATNNGKYSVTTLTGHSPDLAITNGNVFINGPVFVAGTHIYPHYTNGVCTFTTSP